MRVVREPTAFTHTEVQVHRPLSTMEREGILVLSVLGKATCGTLPPQSPPLVMKLT